MSENIQDIYPLSPMQQGMLFHTIYAPESEVYAEQLSCTLNGTLNSKAFKKAIEKVVERHDILRTAFVWEDLDEPLQVVHQTVELPFSEMDWQQKTQDDAKRDLDLFLQELRQNPVELTEAPLMHIYLIRLSADRHFFIWHYHHILSDGWAFPILLAEVFQFYDAFSQNNPLTLPTPRPYKDYISYLQKQDMQAAQDFWKNKLEGFVAPTPLVVDTKNSSDEGYSIEQLILGEELSRELNELARNQKITLNTILQGIWALTLHKYSAEDDIVFGATVSGRPTDLPGADMMAGLFINTLPIRTQVDPQQSAIDWLSDFQQEQASIHQFEYTPLVDIQGWSEVPNNLPLFNSIFVFENYPIAEAVKEQKNTLVISDLKSFEKTNYQITVVISPGNQIGLEIAYETHRIEYAAIRRILEQMQFMLDQIVKNPQQQIREINLTSGMELKGRNTNPQPFENNLTIPELFERQVKDDPSKIAVHFNQESLSYGQLNEKANRLARLLIKNGLVPESIVGISLNRSLDTVVAVMAVLKAGGAYLPIDPEYPKERIDYMLEDSGIRYVITHHNISEIFTGRDLTVLQLDDLDNALAQSSKENPQVNISPNNLAYVIYTSGSTGRPKGVLLQHGGAINMFQNMKKDFLLEPGKSFLQLSSFSFDAAAGELFAPLLSGAIVQMVDKNTLLDMDKLVPFLNENQVKIATIPPSLLSLLPPEEINCFETIVSVGDACTMDLAKRWSSKIRFMNGYGPTEGTIGATWGLVDSSEEGRQMATIGRPLGNVAIHILDPFLNPVPIGVPGEIHIGGIGVARGYHHRPDLSAEKFIPDPFSEIPGARIYKTGDLARFMEDGRIDFVGRVDFQIKIRGFRIELGEIEAEISQIESIKDTAVLAWGEQADSKNIVAYFVSEDDVEIDVDQLRNSLRDSLPEYMLPSAFIEMDAFPLTPNGKINRKALPAPDSLNLTSGQYVAPRNPEEELLATLWADVLNLDKVGVENNFFDLGGHSLLATQLISRISDAFDVEIELRNLFEQPTIAQIATEIERIKTGEAGVSVPPIKIVDRNQKLPLSFAQQRLWFLDQLEPNSPAYNIPTALQLDGNLNVDALEKSLIEIVNRHESLRTIFAEEDGQPFQRVLDEIDFQLEKIDLSPLPEDHGQLELKRVLARDAMQPFNLATGPLFRANLIKLSSGGFAIAINMHHIISDGWSVGVLVNELVHLYTAFTEDKPSPLIPLEIQYADFAHWQQSWLTGTVLEQQLDYWKDKLSGAAPILNIPTDRPRPAVQTSSGATVNFALDTELVEALRQMNKEEGVTMFMSLLASFQVLLRHYSRQDDILVGAPIANRTKSKIEQLIGFFVNTLIMRTDFSDNPEFIELLTQVRETSLGAYAHQDLPFEKLVEELQPRRDMSHSPLFQVAFVLQNIPSAEQGIELPGLTLKGLDGQADTAKYDLTLTMVEGDDKIGGSFEYNTDLFNPETIQGMIGHFQTILQEVVADTEILISDIPLLEDKDRQKILIDWNQTETEFPVDQTVHQVFSQLAEKQPEATALIFKSDSVSPEETLSYSELNIKANKLAHHLIEKGAGPEKIICICMERSLDMIISMLAILKSGAAYVPIDPSYPADRIDYMVEDSQLSLLLTQQKLNTQLSKHQDKLIVIDNIQTQLDVMSTDNPIVVQNPQNLAYVIYTSGSTGKPKGTLLHHEGACNLANLQQKAYDVGPGSRILQFASLSFDAATWEFLMALLSGSTLVLTSTETITSGQELVKLIADQKISTVTLPPSVLAVLPETDLPDLKTIITAGEAVSAELVNNWINGRQFFNAYGPTETTVCASMYKCRPDENAVPPIGKANPNFKLYVLDGFLNPLPPGVPGELCASGVGIARGYHQRPDLSAEKFVPNPFSTEPGDRLYKTGDLVRYRPDGNIEFLGRIDQQVKVRGFRIELAEIESALSAYPGISDQLVMAREDKPGDIRLVAYITQTNNEVIDTQQIKNFLREQLPEYMIPSAIVSLDVFPLTPNGKINRNALPAPELSRDDLSASYEAPRNEPEEKIVSIVSKLLVIEKVGIHDNFFELGGHSLLATQFMSRIKSAFEVEVPLRILFEKPTSAQIAETVTRMKSDGSAEQKNVPQIKRAERRGRTVKRSDLGK